MTARRYGTNAVAQISAEVTLRSPNRGLLGVTNSVPCVLNAGPRQDFVQPNPPPKDEYCSTVRLLLPLAPPVIESIEEQRQGHDLTLQLDLTVLFVDKGEGGAMPDAPGIMSPIRREQDSLLVPASEWTRALETWGRGVGIPILVPLLATEPDPQRRDIVRHLKSARQAIDRGDYPAAIADARKALELLRDVSPATRPLPKEVTQRDVGQRVHAVLQALFDLASAPAHAGEPVKDFVPARADATAVVAGTASVAQQVFARLDH